MGVLSWLGFGGQCLHVRPNEYALFRPTLPLDHPDCLAELEALLEARRIIAGESFTKEP